MREGKEKEKRRKGDGPVEKSGVGGGELVELHQELDRLSEREYIYIKKRERGEKEVKTSSTTIGYRKKRKYR